MRRHRCFAALLAMAALGLSPALTQSAFAQRGGQRQAGPPKPTPRLPDGKVNLGSPPQEELKGTWNAVDNRLIIPELPEEVGLRDQGANLNPGPNAFPKPRMSEVPFQPWAKALYIFRATHEFEPYTRCKPAGGARMVATAYGTDFINVPEQKRIYITQTGGPHSFRPIYMDGRQHPKDLDPSYYGHSVGHWEGDTLVVDTIGFNERAWIDLRGVPTTEQLHTIERFTRPDLDTLHYEITIDDPGAYTAVWKSGMFFRRQAGGEQFEFMCQDGNLAPILMIGEGNVKVDRSSRVAP
jgi:hypothetical protein